MSLQSDCFTDALIHVLQDLVKPQCRGLWQSMTAISQKVTIDCFNQTINAHVAQLIDACYSPYNIATITASPVVKILLVEDDKPVATVLVEVLTAHHYTVDVATDGEIGLELATNWDYELILLDLQIPKLDGIHLCHKLRAQGFQTPILLLTAKDSSADVVKGLDAGADDYVTKPYDLSELLARLRALLRRRETSLTTLVLLWEKLRMNLHTVEVTYAG